MQCDQPGCHGVEVRSANPALGTKNLLSLGAGVAMQCFLAVAAFNTLTCV